MQKITLNQYRLTHKNGAVETVAARNMSDAIASMETPEEVSILNQADMVSENVSTYVPSLPEEIPFEISVEGGNGSIATPASGTIHADDEIALKAVPAPGYRLSGWYRSGRLISTEASFVYTMEPLADGEHSAHITAQFEAAPVAWTAGVSPDGAGAAGCVAFPVSGTVPAFSTLSLIAVAETGWNFDHWERDGEPLGSTKILSTTVQPLATGESAAEYTAVFTEA